MAGRVFSSEQVDSAVGRQADADDCTGCDAGQEFHDRWKGTLIRLRLADDIRSTIAEARFLWWLVDQPNLFIKTPALGRGCPASRRAWAGNQHQRHADLLPDLLRPGDHCVPRRAERARQADQVFAQLLPGRLRSVQSNGVVLASQDLGPQPSGTCLGVVLCISRRGRLLKCWWRPVLAALGRIWISREGM